MHIVQAKPAFLYSFIHLSIHPSIIIFIIYQVI
jgi:hypothetical protein